MMTKGFKLIGLSVRTTNKDNKSAADLGALWGRFFAEKVMDRIPNKASTDIVAVYTDYESDYRGTYTAMIGVPVTTVGDIPAGLLARSFEADNFKIFTAKGEMPAAVVKAWQTIWASDASLNRKYTYDFEVYGPRSQNGPESEVDIYLSVRQS